MVTGQHASVQDHGGGGQNQPWLIAVVVTTLIVEGAALAFRGVDIAVIIALYAAEAAIIIPLLATTRRTTQIQAIAEQQAAEAPQRDAQLVQDISQASAEILSDSGNGTGSPPRPHSPG